MHNNAYSARLNPPKYKKTHIIRAFEMEIAETMWIFLSVPYVQHFKSIRVIYSIYTGFNLSKHKLCFINIKDNENAL